MAEEHVTELEMQRKSSDRGAGKGYCRLLVVPADRPNEPAAWLLRSHRR